MILGETDLRNLIDKVIVAFFVHRLVLMPLAVYVACRLLAVMPAGATTAMLSVKYDCDPQYATKLVIFATRALSLPC